MIYIPRRGSEQERDLSEQERPEGSREVCEEGCGLLQAQVVRRPKSELGVGWSEARPAGE